MSFIRRWARDSWWRRILPKTDLVRSIIVSELHGIKIWHLDFHITHRAGSKGRTRCVKNQILCDSLRQIEASKMWKIWAVWFYCTSLSLSLFIDHHACVQSEILEKLTACPCPSPTLPSQPFQIAISHIQQPRSRVVYTVWAPQLIASRALRSSTIAFRVRLTASTQNAHDVRRVPSSSYFPQIISLLS